MQLGDFLKDVPAAPVEPVTFRIVWKGENGQQTTREVSASLSFVDAYEVHEARRDAQHAVDEQSKDSGTPPLAFDEELIYHLLVRALRDASDPRRPFVGGLNHTNLVVQLKKALLPRVAGELYAAYSRFIVREFPSTVSDRDRIEMEQAAQKHQ